MLPIESQLSKGLGNSPLLVPRERRVDCVVACCAAPGVAVGGREASSYPVVLQHERTGKPHLPEEHCVASDEEDLDVSAVEQYGLPVCNALMEESLFKREDNDPVQGVGSKVVVEAVGDLTQAAECKARHLEVFLLLVSVEGLAVGGREQVAMGNPAHQDSASEQCQQTVAAARCDPAAGASAAIGIALGHDEAPRRQVRAAVKPALADTASQPDDIPGQRACQEPIEEVFDNAQQIIPQQESAECSHEASAEQESAFVLTPQAVVAVDKLRQCARSVLRVYCGQLGLNTTGNKLTLAQRLAYYLWSAGQPVAPLLGPSNMPLVPGC